MDISLPIASCGVSLDDPVGSHIESALVVVPGCTTSSYSAALSYLPLSHHRNIFFLQPSCFDLLYDKYKMKTNNRQEDARKDRKERETVLLQAHLGRAPYTP